MANKKGKSEKKKDWLGKSYIQHYDSKGNKSGRSERKETFFGKSYTQHYTAKGEKRGKSEKKKTWLGREYTQKYNAKGEKTGRSENKETWLGSAYRQHYDAKGNKTDWTERKETWLGKKYVQRYGEDAKRVHSRSSGPAGGSRSQNSGSGYSTSGDTSYYGGSATNYPSSGSSPASTSNAFSQNSSVSADAIRKTFKRTAQALLAGILLYPVIGLGGCLTRIVVQGTPPHPYDPAHEQWLTGPMRSWSTEAIYIPLVIVAITFLVSLAQLNKRNVALKVLTIVLGAVSVIYVGRNLFSSLDYRFPGTTEARNVRTARVVPDKDLNLRSGAGKQYSRLMTIPRNTEVIVLGETQYVENELWVKVRVGSTEGWVHKSFLR
jgi:SH3 domain-containing protein